MDYTLANKTFDKYELVIKRLENLAVSLNTQLVESKDKLSRRNMQIKDLKTKLSEPQKSTVRIEKITIERITDNNPDLSYLTQDYSDIKDLKERQKYLEQDKKRLEDYNNGQWEMLGITAKAEVSYDIGQGNRRIERFTSGGLWGIESDSKEEYLKKIEQKQLEDLKTHLKIFNVDISNFKDKINL